MFKKHNLNFPEPYNRSMKKTNAEEDMNNDWNIDNIDDCLVNFGISDDDLDILLNEVNNGRNPSSASKKAIEGVDQKGLANLLTRIFTIAMKNRTGLESLIPAAFDLISEIIYSSDLATSEHGENPILSSCLKNLEKTSMAGDDWEKLPDILADSYVRWDLAHCVGELLVKWLAVQSVQEELTMEHEKVLIGRGVKNCRVLLGKIGGRIWSDLPGRFVQLQQMVKRLLLGEECSNKEELLEIIIMLSAVNEREAVAHVEESKDNQEQIDLKINHEDEDENDSYEELISFAEMEKLKQNLEEKLSKKIKLISPSQYENVDYEEKIDNINNNNSTEVFGIEVEMAKLSMLDNCEANDKPQKQCLTLAPSNNSKNANDSPTIEAKYDSKGRKLLGFLQSLDNLKDPKASTYPVTSGCYLGRLPSCQVAIDGPKVSRVHATIFKTVDGIFLQTLSKTNGCCVNNNIVATDNFIRIVNGDNVTIGGIPFVWIENGEKDEKLINKVIKEGGELEVEKVKKDLVGKTIKQEGGSNNKKNKSKLNVAAVLEASLKKVRKSMPSGQDFGDSGTISSVPMKVPDLSVPPPSANFQMMENNNQDVLELFQSQKIRPHNFPNFAIPPPNIDIQTQKKEENKRKYGLPKVQHNRKSPNSRHNSGIRFHTQMLNKNNSKSKRPQSSSRSAFDGEKLLSPLSGKQSSSEMVASSVDITGQRSKQSALEMVDSSVDITGQRAKQSSLEMVASSVDITGQRSKQSSVEMLDSTVDITNQRRNPSSLEMVASTVDITGHRSNQSSLEMVASSMDITDQRSKQSSLEMVASSVDITGKRDENIRHDKRDFFKIKMTKKIQEIDDVVIESERLITNY